MVDYLTAAVPDIQGLIVGQVWFADAACLGRTNRYWSKTWRNYVTNTIGGDGPARRFLSCPRLTSIGLTTLNGLAPGLFAAWPRLVTLRFCYHAWRIPVECPLPAVMPGIHTVCLDAWYLVGVATPDAFIARFPNLETLRLGSPVSHHGIPAVTLSRLTRLTTLEVFDNLHCDLSQFASLTTLKTLNITCLGTCSGLERLANIVRAGKLREFRLSCSTPTHARTIADLHALDRRSRALCGWGMV